MKKALIFLLLIIFIKVSYTQTSYYTAIEIAKEKTNFISTIELLNSEGFKFNRDDSIALKDFLIFLYDPFDSTLFSIDPLRIKSILVEHDKEINDLIKRQEEKHLLLKKDNAQKSKNFKTNYNLKEATIGAISPGLSLGTKIIDASAQFLVERTKEELTLAFFNKFKDQLDSKFVLRSLFPNTYLLLKTRDYFQIPSMGEMWVAAFKTDLQEIPENLEKIVLVESQLAEIGRKEEFRAFVIAIKLIRMQEHGMHPAEILEYLSTQYNHYEYLLDKGINIVNLISNNLRDTIDNKTWVPYHKLQNMNSEEKKYFVALIYQKGRKEKLFENSLINTENYSSIMNGILELSSILEYTDKILTDLKSENTLSKFSKFKEYTQHFYDVLDWAIKFKFQINHDFAGYYNSNYYKAFKPIMDNTFKTINAFQANEIGVGFLYGFKTTEMILSLVDSNNQDNLNKIAYYGNFMVDIVTADSTMQIKEIINKYALPVGSYQIKRKSTFSIDLNAFPGVYLGYETDFKNPESHSLSNGIGAPIGLSFSWGIKRTCDLPLIQTVEKKEYSYSIFLSIIDIGAPLSYRWANDTAQGLPANVKLEQILSPGIHFIWGIKDSPISIMVGGQFTPLLRKIEAEQNILSEINTFRFGITLAVDIPIFNLYRKE